MIYFDSIKVGTKYRMCSFSDEHVFTYETIEDFDKNNCLYCSNKLIDKIFIQNIDDE
jgi:hypothetical protein